MIHIGSLLSKIFLCHTGYIFRNDLAYGRLHHIPKHIIPLPACFTLPCSTRFLVRTIHFITTATMHDKQNTLSPLILYSIFSFYAFFTFLSIHSGESLIFVGLIPVFTNYSCSIHGLVISCPFGLRIIKP